MQTPVLGCNCPEVASVGPKPILFMRRIFAVPPASVWGRGRTETCGFSLTEIVLAQLDEITPLEQTVLKFAAIIGPVFTTQLLSYILPIRMRHKMTTLLDSLVSDNILKWTESTEEPEDVQDPSKEPATPPQAEIGKW